MEYRYDTVSSNRQKPSVGLIIHNVLFTCVGMFVIFKSSVLILIFVLIFVCCL